MTRPRRQLAPRCIKCQTQINAPICLFNLRTYVNQFKVIQKYYDLRYVWHSERQCLHITGLATGRFILFRFYFVQWHKVCFLVMYNVNPITWITDRQGYSLQCWCKYDQLNVTRVMIANKAVIDMAFYPTNIGAVNIADVHWRGSYFYEEIFDVHC